MPICQEAQPDAGEDRGSNAVAEQKLQEEDSADQALRLYRDQGTSERKDRESGKPNLSDEARERILALYDEYRPRLYRYMRSMQLGRDQAEEVIQETFMRLTMELLDERGIENVQGWIVRVAHNLAVNLMKKERRPTMVSEASTFLIENRADPASSPEEVYSKKERVRRINAVLATLKPQHRQCFQMRAQGFRYRDISLALGVSEQRAAFVVKQVAVRLAADCE